MFATVDDNLICRRERADSHRLGALGVLGGKNRFSSPSGSAPISLTNSSGSGSYASFSPITAPTSSISNSGINYAALVANAVSSGSYSPIAAAISGSSSSPISLASSPSTAAAAYGSGASNILGGNYSLSQFGANPSTATDSFGNVLNAVEASSPSAGGWFTSAAYSLGQSGVNAANYIATGAAALVQNPSALGPGTLQGLANVANGGQDIGVGVANLTIQNSLPGYIANLLGQPLPTISSPDWSNNLVVQNDTTHGISEWLGGFGAMNLVTLGAGSIPGLVGRAAEPTVLSLSDWNLQQTAGNATEATIGRIGNVGQRAFDYAVENPRVSGLNRAQLGKDAEIQATRTLRRWAERNGVGLGQGGLSFQVRGANSIPDVVYDPAKQIFDFKLAPTSVRPSQTQNILNDFPGYDLQYIYGPDLGR
jgi:hypothetical protein